MTDLTISVYGYGRFGRLWADILSQDFHVKVFSRRGLTPDEVSQGIEICDEKEIFNCDALFFCVAISSFEAVLKQSAPHADPRTLFFDTCSVKVLPAEWMQAHLPRNCSIIATHPMFGPDSYRQMERALPMVMCNITADAQQFEQWRHYFASKSMQVVQMTPREHDKTVAYSQGITHYVGRVLAELKLKQTPIDTHGYRLLCRIIEQTCNDSVQLFYDLNHFNPYAKQMLRELKNCLETIDTALAGTEQAMTAGQPAEPEGIAK